MIATDSILRALIRVVKEHYNEAGKSDLEALTLPHFDLTCENLCKIVYCGEAQCKPGETGCAAGQAGSVCKCTKSDTYNDVDALIEGGLMNAGRIKAHLTTNPDDQNLDDFVPTCE